MLPQERHEGPKRLLERLPVRPLVGLSAEPAVPGAAATWAAGEGGVVDEHPEPQRLKHPRQQHRHANAAMPASPAGHYLRELFFSKMQSCFPKLQ